MPNLVISILLLSFTSLVALPNYFFTANAQNTSNEPLGVAGAELTSPSPLGVAGAELSQQEPLGVAGAELNSSEPIIATAGAELKPQGPSCDPKKDKDKCTSAAGKFCEGGKLNTAIGCIPTDPKELIPAILKLAIGVAGGLSLLFMVFGAFKMITSSGNPESLKAGQEQFQAAVIGLLFIIFSVLLLQILGADILNIPGFGGT